MKTALNDEGVKAQENDLEEDNCVVAEYGENHVVLHEKPDGKETEAGEEETDEKHEPSANRSEESCHQ